MTSYHFCLGKFLTLVFGIYRIVNFLFLVARFYSCYVWNRYCWKHVLQTINPVLDAELEYFLAVLQEVPVPT